MKPHPVEQAADPIQQNFSKVSALSQALSPDLTHHLIKKLDGVLAAASPELLDDFALGWGSHISPHEEGGTTAANALAPVGGLVLRLKGACTDLHLAAVLNTAGGLFFVSRPTIAPRQKMSEEMA